MADRSSFYPRTREPLNAVRGSAARMRGPAESEATPMPLS